jgi:hypothetical protein
MMMKLIDVESLHKCDYSTVLINNPTVHVNRNGASWIVRFIGERVNIDFRLDPENEATAKIIAKTEASLFEGLDMTVAVYCGALYVVIGHESTEHMLNLIMKELQK